MCLLKHLCNITVPVILLLELTGNACQCPLPCIQSVLAFIFAKCTVTGVVYLDMFDEFLLPIFIEEDPNDMQLQQDGALLNFHIAVRAGLSA